MRWLDPKLERFREKRPEKKYVPKSIEEFIDVIRRTPKNVLSIRERERIAAVMSFEERKVEDIMIPKKEMVFVSENEYLGPLILDKLYKSGFTHFPVVDKMERVKGVIHTEALNALEIKKTDKAEKYLDRDVKYLHVGDSLAFAIEEVLRTDGLYFMVLGKNEELEGFLTIKEILGYFVV